MKTTKGRIAVMITMFAALCIGAGLIGCKKKSSDNNQTSSGGGTPAPAPTPPLPQHTLSVTKSGNGNIASSPAGISCGTTCSKAFDEGSVVTLTPSPGDGFTQFTGWSGACTGAGACSVTMSDVKSVAATFGPVSFDGLWSGVTNQGKNMEFLVQGEKVMVYEASYTFVGGGCLFDGWARASFNSSGLTIGPDHSFNDPSGAFGMGGTFSSGTQASGTFRYTSSSCGATINLTWTANKSGVGIAILRSMSLPPPGKYSGVTDRE